MNYAPEYRYIFFASEREWFEPQVLLPPPAILTSSSSTADQQQQQEDDPIEVIDLTDLGMSATPPLVIREDLFNDVEIISQEEFLASLPGWRPTPINRERRNLF